MGTEDRSARVTALRPLWIKRFVGLVVLLAGIMTFAPGGIGSPFATSADEPAVSTVVEPTTETTLPPTTTTTTTLPMVAETTTDATWPSATTTTTIPPPPEDPATDTTALSPAEDLTTQTTPPPTTTTTVLSADELIAETTLPPAAPASVDFFLQEPDTLLKPLVDALAAPAIGIVKSLASYDDNDSSGTITSGDGLWYQFDVTNSGDVTLDNIGVVDNTFTIAVTCPVTVLAPSESTTCTTDAAHTVTATEALAGNVHNEATATGTDPGAAPVTATDALDTAVAAPDYQWVPSNIGHRTWDPGSSTWVTGLPNGYTEGETAPLRISIPATAGRFLKLHVCLELGSSPGPYAFTRIDPWNRSYQPSPPPTLGGLTGEVGGFNGSRLTIDSVAFLGNGGGLCSTGWQGWEVRFHMNLTGGSVVYGARIAAPGGAIAAGGTVSTGQGASHWPGTFRAGIGTGNTVVRPVPFNASLIDQQPATIIVEKQTSPDADPTRFTFTGSPTGTIVDGQKLSQIVEPGRYTSTEIVPAGWDLTSIVCDDGNSSGDVDSATATFNAEAGEIVTCVFTNTEHDPSITVEKATNGQDADTPTGPSIPAGDPVDWTYVVTNTGNVTLTGITVTDDQGVTVTCPQDTLDPGESMTCTASGIATAGQYENEGHVSGFDPTQTEVTSIDPSHYFGAGPGITIEKATNGQDADTPTGPSIPAGDPVDWTYVVTNTGNVTLTGITVTDDQGVTVTCPQDTLDPGESMTCTASGIATAGQYENEGHVSGFDPTQTEVTSTDPSHYFGTRPSITPPQTTLPATGADADRLSSLGFILLGLGTAAVLGTRRRVPDAD